MRRNRSMPASTVIPVLGYDDVREAAAWLSRAFGLRERLRIADHRIQLECGDGHVVVTDAGSLPADARPAHSVMVRVEDADAHHAQAVRSGASILAPPVSFPYGERQYSARDIGGHIWTFSQTIEDVDPISWGGEVMAERD